MNNQEILVALRKELSAIGLDALIVGSEDCHQSEYVCEADMRRAFVSGFTGSAGTALITKDKALLWTDGRYFLQAEQQLTSDWTLMKSGQPGVPEMQKWILDNLSAGQTVGIDAWLVSTSAAKSMERVLKGKEICFKAVDSNPVDKVWTDRPPAPAAPLLILPLCTTGQEHQGKIAEVRRRLEESQAQALLVTLLDEVAWLLNLRGGDIPYNPVFFSYAIVTLDKVILCIDEQKATEEVRRHLGAGVEVRGYEEIETLLQSIASQGKILVDPSKVNWRLYNTIGSSAVDQVSCLQLPKSVKNEAELQGMRACHVRDGVALTAFLHWLETTVTANPNQLTECQAVDKLEEFRGKMAGHVGPSFDTIAGYGPNGAIIHYKPQTETCASIGTDSIFLLDSGAQYQDGTTDVTRTMHFGYPSAHMKKCYTAVLKGHIALANMVIPEGTLGSRIDSIARMALWQHGLDYNHGTGHGVGAFLNVHEGPQGIGFRYRENEAGFQKGMTISNEPGYYEDGGFGIRIETILIAVEKDTAHHFNNKKYLGFETITMTPICTKLIDTSLMTDGEIEWVNNYHQEVREKLLPLMKETFPETVDYLVHETQPINKAQ